MSGPLMSVKDLKIGFRGLAILPPISFDLFPGQVTSIVGHNGSGKSTLLKTLLGLLPNLGGSINLSHKSRIGYVPQRETMDPIYPVSVMDVVETGRYGIRGPGKRLSSEDKEKIRLVMISTGISNLETRLFRTLSGGEQQRTLLARALCTDPQIVILDEPTASMDEQGAKDTMDMTLRLANDQGAAVLMVNHFIDLVSQVSKQVVFLDRDKQKVKIGTPAEIFKERIGVII